MLEAAGGRLAWGANGGEHLRRGGAEERERLPSSGIERLAQPGTVLAVLQAVICVTCRMAALRGRVEPGLANGQPRRLPRLRLFRTTARANASHSKP